MRTNRVKSRRPPARNSIGDQLREIIASRNLTAYSLGRDAGVDQAAIQRFLNNERDIRVETLDRIAAVLKLRLVEVALPTRRRPPAPAELPAENAVIPEYSSIPAAPAERITEPDPVGSGECAREGTDTIPSPL